MTESLLDNSNTQTDPKNYLQELVGEDKKFKDTESLARGKYEADIHIRNLETRIDQMREDLLQRVDADKTRATLEDLVRQLESNKQLASSELPPAKEVNQPSIKPEDIQSLLASEIPKHVSAYELQRRENENFNNVKAKLVEKFGPNYGQTYQDKIKSLGLDATKADELARSAPTAFMTMLGLDQQTRRESFQAPPQSTGAFRPMGEVKKTESYYDNMLKEMRKTNPRAYYSPKTLVEMDKSAQELGEAFFDKP